MAENRVSRMAKVAVVALGVSLVAAACGTSGTKSAGGANVSTQGVLSSAYQSALAVHSARLGVDVSVTPATGTTIHVTGSGAVQWQPLLGSFELSIPLGSAGDTTFNYRLLGNDMYIEVPPSLAGQTGGKTWLEGSLSSLVSSGEAGEFDPADELALLSARATSVTKVGSATVAGEATTEYSADINLADTSGESATLQALLSKLEQVLGSDVLPVQVWIDGAGRLVQLAESLTLKDAPAGASAQAANAFPIKESLTETLSDYGVAVSVTAPPPSQVQPINLPQILQGAGL